MFKNLGVTLMELLIVLVIVGILAALRFSDFGKLNEKNKGVEAEANLYLIYNAQKRYARSMMVHIMAVTHVKRVIWRIWR